VDTVSAKQQFHDGLLAIIADCAAERNDEYDDVKNLMRLVHTLAAELSFADMWQIVDDLRPRRYQ
jgi:hypothetical protein